MNCMDKDGYIRYFARGSRVEFEHRMVARIAWGPRVLFPKYGRHTFHVHHMDRCRIHNCRQNLVIIDPRLHDARLSE
jgi:hypothetical protein